MIVGTTAQRIQANLSIGTGPKRPAHIVVMRKELSS